MARVALQFTVNGAEQAEFVEEGALLVDVLRDKLGLTATKNGCGQGTCGACTVTIDGELSARTPVTFGVLRNGLRVMVPGSSTAATLEG